MRHPLLDTLDQMSREQSPNFFRLYLNPHVARACFCLGKMVQDTWYGKASEQPEFQTFLANSFDEALSGAVKLARFVADAEGRPKTGLIIGAGSRLDHFASLALGDRGRLELIPDLLLADEVSEAEADALSRKRFGYVILFPPEDSNSRLRLDSLIASFREPPPLVIACVGRQGLDACRALPSLWWDGVSPDIVVFDESFVRRHVPFGAFAARKALYEHWNQPGYSTFHSTTFQPNTVSTLHFMKCLEQDDPAFYTRVAGRLERIASEPAAGRSVFARSYNSALCKTIASLGFDVFDVKAAGHYVTVRGRQIFDGVAGIACSVRGHNPPTYLEEVESLDHGMDCRQAVRERLQRLTRLECLLPAVSGASAVENALRIGLAAQFPRKYVLALKGGFGGKTLFALTGTAKAFYKERIDPLYPSVVYVDPFGDRAVEELESAFQQYPVGVVQLEIVQAVGGVRAIPERVVHYLDGQRGKYGYLLFVDEVQTGMYRTGPFTMSEGYGLIPDVMTIGKGTSDMMFPFAVTLYSAALQRKLDETGSSLAPDLLARADYEFGYRTLLNTLDRAEAAGLSAQAKEAGALFRAELARALAECDCVRDVRVFGLLIGIELNMDASLGKWFRKQMPFLYILNMLLHRSFPLLIGYCQYEPHVLKLTPPLTITPSEIARLCATIGDVLKTPWYGLLPPALGHLTRTQVRAWRAGGVSPLMTSPPTRPERKTLHEPVAR